MAAGRRGNREGSVFRRASDRRWVGELSLDYGMDGKPRRRRVTAKTRQEVLAKLRALQRQIDDGLPPPTASSPWASCWTAGKPPSCATR